MKRKISNNSSINMINYVNSKHVRCGTRTKKHDRHTHVRRCSQMAAAVPVRIIRLVDFPRRELQDLFDWSILVVRVRIEAGQLGSEAVIELGRTGRDVQLHNTCKHVINMEMNQMETQKNN